MRFNLDWPNTFEHALYILFIASRSEPDIQRELTQLGVVQVTMKSALVNDDIRSHIRALLLNESRFTKWPEAVKKEIEVTLVEQSSGM